LVYLSIWFIWFVLLAGLATPPVGSKIRRTTRPCSPVPSELAHALFTRG
jgi:hypothetical protein